MDLQLVWEDVGFGLLWLLANGFMVHTAVVATKQIFPGESRVQLILHVAVLFVAICTLSLTIVGALGFFSRVPILASAFLTSYAAKYCLPRVRSEFFQTRPEPAGTGWLWIVFAGLLTGHVVVHGLLRFPEDFDCLTYHLPFIDHWIQAGTLATTESARWSTPAASELLGAWFAAVFTGDFLVGLNNVPVMIVWASSLVEVSRQIGLTGWWKHLAAIACLAVHTSVHESVDTSNDLMVAAFFVAGLAYALRFQKSRACADAILFAISLGLLAGVKFFAIGYAAVLCVVFAGVTLHAKGAWSSLRVGAYVGLISFFVGGYWFTRNFVMTGYPLFPLGSPTMKERIIYPDMWKTTLAFNGHPAVPDLAMDAVWRLCGPIHFAAVALTPVAAFAFTMAPMQTDRRSSSGRVVRYVMTVSLLGALSVLLVTPMLVEDQPNTLNHLRWAYTPVRYGLCFLCMAVLALFMLMRDVTGIFLKRRASAAAWAVGTVAVAQLAIRYSLADGYNMALAALTGLGISAVVCIGVWLCRRGKMHCLATMAAVTVVLCISIAALSFRWHTQLPRHFNHFYATGMFSRLDVGTGQRIVVLDDRSYAFFGSRRQNYVIHPQLYYDVETTKQLARAREADLVATRVDNYRKLFRYRSAWDGLASDPFFDLEAKGRELRLYRFLAPSGSVPVSATNSEVGR